MAITWAAAGLGLEMVFLAGLLRGFTGLGFSLSVVLLLSLIVPPSQAVPMVLLLQLLVSVAGLRDVVRLGDWRPVWVLALGAAVAIPLGTWGLVHLQAGPIRLVIAAIVVTGAAVLAGGFRLAVAPTGAGALSFGMAAGLFNGLAGIAQQRCCCSRPPRFPLGAPQWITWPEEAAPTPRVLGAARTFRRPRERGRYSFCIGQAGSQAGGALAPNV